MGKEEGRKQGLEELKQVKLQVEGRIATIRLNHPPANAMSRQMVEELGQVLEELRKNDRVKVILLAGEGKFFAAGADIKELAHISSGEEARELALKGQSLLERIETFHKPIIALIHGAALGGGLELAMACHMRFATEGAKLGLPELNLGIIPGFAGTQRLPRLVGKAKALEMILTGEPVSGEIAKQISLVNGIYSEEEIWENVTDIAARIAEKGKIALTHALLAVERSETVSVREGGAWEAELFGKSFETEDKKEGMAAFLEKRPPKFSDR